MDEISTDALKKSAVDSSGLGLKSCPSTLEH